MSIKAYTSLAMALLSYSAVCAQNVQTNNRGVIVNQVLVVPTYSRKTSADYLQNYENGRAASAAAGAAAGEAYVRQAMDRVEANLTRSEVGAPLDDSPVFEVKDRPFVLHSSRSFSAADDLEWTIPLGTQFRLLTLPGPGGIVFIRLLNLNLRVPATRNGFSHTPGLMETGYVQVADFRRGPGQ